MFAQAPDCSGLPTQFSGNPFPTGDFFSNFNNDCYTIAFSTGNGANGQEGDMNSIYSRLYFNVNPAMPPYQLIIIGTFPNS
jgi:hypothetical protein